MASNTRPRSTFAAVAAGLLSLVAVVPAALGSIVTPGLGALTSFTGGDPGEGLDLTGSFVYALSFGETNPTDHTVQGLAFNPASPNTGAPAGVSITSALDYSYTENSNSRVNLGGSADDGTLGEVMSEVTYGSDFTVTLAVAPGSTYKLQLLLQEAWTGASPQRIFDIYHETPLSNTPVLAIDELDLGGETTGSEALVYTYTFTAADSSYAIRLLDSPTGSDPAGLINGLTLEALEVPEPSSLALLGLATLWLGRRRNQRV